MKRITRMFRAQGDDHKSYTIYEYTDFTTLAPHDDSTAEIPGLKELLISDGTPVDYKEKGVYQIVTTSVILRCNAPSAP
jgi:hypothetical protein